MRELEEFWATAEEKYARLRALGIRKEDARFLLPNAAETRIVTTMNFAAWSHFLWLRAVDKAAQWEIRRMGQHVLTMLHAIAPEVFAEHWQVYQESVCGRHLMTPPFVSIFRSAHLAPPSPRRLPNRSGAR